MKRKHTIVYDAQCPLCRTSVKFVENFDRNKKFSFIPFQSENIDDEDISGTPGDSIPDSVSLHIKGKKHDKSTAVLHIFKEMGFPWNLLYIFIFIPKLIRDNMYDFIAKRRKRTISN